MTPPHPPRSPRSSRSSTLRFELRSLPVAATPAGALVLCDEAAIVRFASDGVRSLLGCAPEDLTGRSVRSLAFEAGFSEAALDDLAATLLGGGTGGLEVVLDADGASRELEVSVQAMPAREGAGREFVAVLTDVTARHQAERERAESEHRYRHLVEASPYPIVVHAGGRIRFINPAGLALVGAKTTQEVVGRSIMEFVHPDFRGIVAERARKMLETGEPGYLLEEKLLRLDGREIEVEVAGARIAYEGEPAIQLVGRDVTERRRAEVERQRFAERQREDRRRESLAALATGLAHQLSALSSAIVEAVDRRLEKGARRLEAQALVGIRASGLRVATLTEQLRAYAGTKQVRPGRVALPQLVLELSERIESEIPPGISLSYDLPGDARPVQADPALVQRIVLDLVRNAVDALGAKGGVRVGARLVELDAVGAAKVQPPGALPPGPCMALEVSDDGCGMDAETRSRVLDPFFSTKAEGRGLGLSEVLGLVRAQRGGLQIETARGKGTCVRVLFPLGPRVAASR